MRTLRWTFVQSAWSLYENKEVGQSPQPMCCAMSAQPHLISVKDAQRAGLEETQNYRE